MGVHKGTSQSWPVCGSFGEMSLRVESPFMYQRVKGHLPGVTLTTQALSFLQSLTTWGYCPFVPCSSLCSGSPRSSVLLQSSSELLPSCLCVCHRLPFSTLPDCLFSPALLSWSALPHLLHEAFSFSVGVGWCCVLHGNTRSLELNIGIANILAAVKFFLTFNDHELI